MLPGHIFIRPADQPRKTAVGLDVEAVPVYKGDADARVVENGFQPRPVALQFDLREALLGDIFLQGNEMGDATVFIHHRADPG